MKKEYAKLHERYTDLFRTHIDYMERTKAMLGADRLEQLQSLGAARSKIPPSLAINQMSRCSLLNRDVTTRYWPVTFIVTP